MSIVALVKVTAYGYRSEKSRILEDLQNFGCLHIISLNPGREAAAHGGPSSEAREALHFLLSCPNRRKQVRSSADFNPLIVERQALNLKSQINTLQDKRDFLLERIANLKPWGEFEFPPLDALNNHRLWFYLVPEYQMKDLPEGLVWQEVKHDNRFHYLVAVSEHEPEAMPVPRVRTGNRSVKELEHELEAVEIALEDLQAERASLTRWGKLFAKKLNWLEDFAARETVAQQTYDDSTLFALQAWAPAKQCEMLLAYAEQHTLVMDIEEPTPDEQPPTLLENEHAFASGQDLVLFYMTPSYRLWDPSTVVFFSFALFFAIIISDAGYGALLGLLLFWKWKAWGQTKSMKRMRTLFAYLVGASIVWGAMVGGYFGVVLGQENFLANFQVLDVNNYNAMMILSILLGVVHLCIGNFADFRCKGNSPQRWASIGWIGIITGGFLVWIGSMGTGVLTFIKIVGILAMLGGGGLAFWFVNPHPVWWKRALGGFNIVPKLSAAFGDTLSYLRLFALGLAGSSLSGTFNSLGMALDDAVPGIGVLLAIFVIVFGHVLNFGLSLMGAVIHGLRLNYIEFFNWGMPEEGYLFKAFARKESGLWKE